MSKRRIAGVLLALYIVFILLMTLICREPGADYQYKLELFWSWQEFDVQAKQILLNIILFIPFGTLLFTVLSGILKNKLLITIFCGFLLSCFIEITQLVFKLGLCELDDIMDNTLGTLMGIGIVLILWRSIVMFKGKNGIYNRIFKRVIDVVCALLAFSVFSWLYAIVAVLVRVKLGSPIIFKQARPGKIDPKTGKETIFYLYKFRSMTDEKDKNGKLLPDDVRLTKFGRFLRSTSMDELPEAFNILKGDMSVIGPRPLLVEYLPNYTDEEHHRHDVRPGLSGWAQINGRNAIDSWEQRFEYDLEYVKKVSFLFDVKVVLVTVVKVLKRSDIQVGSQIKVGRLDDARRSKV